MFDLKDWRTTRDSSGSLHIVPNNDIQDHPLKWSCPCEPAFVAIMDQWGLDCSWVFEHMAFDGREE